MKTNIFLAALLSYDNRSDFVQKINVCEARRSPLVKVQWSTVSDLHITLGYIPAVEEKDVRLIAQGLSSVSQTSGFMANVEELRLYGNAIVLRLNPYHQFLSIHQKMNQKLQEATHDLYQFQVKGRFDPHLTMGRIRNLAEVNPLHQHQLRMLVEEQFKGKTFLIKQAALLRRMPEQSHAAYQSIQLYALK